MKMYKSKLLDATVFPEERLILFYGGIFSQWADCEYNIYIGPSNLERVNCAEQAMMLYKAHIFRDMETYMNILNADHPRDQKMLGRMVKGFDPVEWDKVALDFVTKSNYEKFRQNLAWGELLLLTDPYELVEASPTDRIWGIGYGEDNPNVFKERANWGTNLLGRAIMNARDLLIKDHEASYI